MTTPLKVEGHLLWPDGTISVEPHRLVDYLLRMKGKVDRLAVSSSSPEVEEFNSVSDEPISVKTSCKPIFLNWVLPERYKYLDLDEYLLGLVEKIERDELYDKRVERLSEEIWLFKKLELDDVLRVLIYVLDTLTEKQVVWGVGRGSSCSSYLLYLLGLHEIDPVKYEIEITDFLRLEGD